MFFITEEDTIPAPKVENANLPAWPTTRDGLVPFSNLLLLISVSLGLGDELILDDGRLLERRTCRRHGWGRVS